MPTIIDSLIVKLGLDAADFTTGQKAASQALLKTKEDANTSAKAIEASGKQAAEFFTKMRNEAIALFAVFLGATGIKDFVRQVDDSSAAVGRFAAVNGMSVQAVSTWEGAVKRVGGAAEDADSSIQSLTNTLEQWRSGQGMSPQAGFLQRMGITGDDLTDPQKVLAKEHAWLSNLAKTDPRMAKYFANGAGNSDAMSRLLMSSDAEFNAAMAAGRRQAVTPADSDAAVKFNNALQDIRDSLTVLGRTIVTDITPVLVPLLKSMSDWVDQHKGPILQFFKDLAEALRSGVWTKVRDDIMAWQDGLGAFGKAAEALVVFMMTSWVARMVMPLVSVLNLIIQMTAALSSGLVGGFGLAGTAATGFSALIAGLFGAGAAAGAMNVPMVDDQGRPTGTWGGGDQKDDSTTPYQPLLERAWHWITGSSGGSGASPAREAYVRDRIAGSLGMSGDAASGVVSNFIPESGLESGINEKHPLVPGSRGGFGLAQWTGPRRDAMEAWSRAHGLDPASDEANFGYLAYDLKTNYPALLAQLQSGKLTAEQSADLFYQYESGGAASLEKNRGAHVANAARIAKLAPARIAPNTPGAPPVPGTEGRPQIDPGLVHGAPSVAPGAPGNVTNAPVSHTSSNDTQIHAITIHTAAKDADGIAKSIGAAIKKNLFVVDANYGLA